MNQFRDITTLSDDDLLKMRLCDLPVQIAGTWLSGCVEQLYRELEAQKLAIRPPCYLADEWLTPDKEPVVGIPFYLAHPRLKELEQHMMHDVEGGNEASCMRLLRHETGHAINYAYQLYRRKKWKQLFGHFNKEYPDRYKYQPYSKSFVIHLEEGYAQYHPDEDFAETFAVWLDPHTNWQKKYCDWKALEKLAYMDTLMRHIALTPPPITPGKLHWAVWSIKTTLATHYKKRTAFYAESYPDYHDVTLRNIFPPDQPAPRIPAYRVLNAHKKRLVDTITHWTGERKYIIHQLVKNLIVRVKHLSLECGSDTTLPLMQWSSYVTTLVMNYIHTNRFRREREKT